MAKTVDIKKVFSGSVSEVSVDSLSKKGFKQVKVLNQASVLRLIAEAVDRVLTERVGQISASEREKVIKESRSEFENLAKDRLRKERGRIETLEAANQSLAAQLETLNKRASASIEVQAERDQAVARVQAASSELEALQGQVSGLREQLDEKTKEALEFKEKIEQQQSSPAEAEQLREQITDLQGQIESKASETSELHTQISRMAQEASDLQAQVAAGREREQEKATLQQDVLAQERRVAELEGLLSAKSQEVEQARAQAAQATATSPKIDELLAKLSERAEGQQSSAVGEIKSAHTGLSEKISKISKAGGGDIPADVDDVSLEAFFAKAGGEDVESNVSKVNVRQAKAGAVKGALAKLKKLQQGGEDG
jgi:chromosome segregation ATPase